MFLARCPWYIAGPLIGLFIIGLRAFLNKPFGALGGYIDFAQGLKTNNRFGFSVFLLLGLVLGGTLYAVTTGTFSFSFLFGSSGGPLPKGFPARILLLLFAGLLMGYGARAAGGCTSGHGLSGISLGSLGSVVATMTFFATAVGLAHLYLCLGSGQ